MDTEIADIYCGGIFNSDGATTADGSVFSKMDTYLFDSLYSALFILAFIPPPQVYVFTPGAESVKSATGASLQYFLTGCGSRVTSTTEN